MSVALLHPRVATAFYGRFAQLRPVQVEAIRLLVAGHNLVLSSGTGSGKTEAVTAPLVHRHWEEAARSSSLVLVYVAPTKALVNDLEKRIAPPLRSLGLRVGIRHGDRDDLVVTSKPAVLVTTPESLEVLLFRKDNALSSVRAVVVDEVHLLYNTQRGLQLSSLIQRLQRLCSRQLQWAALSATIGRLTDIRDFLFGPSMSCEFLEGDGGRNIDALVKPILAAGTFNSVVEQMIGRAGGKLLVFANSRRQCEELADSLSADTTLRSSVFAHYSSLSPEVRIETERAFAASPVAVCLATSTLELGIDIGDIDAVVLWGAPPGIESFLQRIGRGNRRSDKTNVLCLIPPGCPRVIEALRFLALIHAACASELPIRRPFELYGAVGQQCLSMIASDSGRFTRIADLCTVFEHQSHLRRPVIERILAELADHGYLQPHGFKNQYGAAERLYELVDYRMIYGNFGAESDSVNIYYKSKLLGTVPAINLLRVSGGSAVRFAGKSWVVQRSNRDGIRVVPASHTRGVVDFVYPGTGPDTDTYIPNRMWELLHSDVQLTKALSRDLVDEVVSFRDELRRYSTKDQIPYVRHQGGVLYFTFGGYLVNKAIGLSSGCDFRANEVTLWVTTPVNLSDIAVRPEAYDAVFASLFESPSDFSVYQSSLPADLQLAEFLQIWLKDETISLALRRLRNSTPVALKESFGSECAARVL